MMELEGTLPYKGYNIRIRNGAFGGISATVFSASGQPLATLIGDYSEEAKKRAKTWIDNQDESDATLFLGSLAQRDQDVDRLEKELAAANERIAALEAENAKWKKAFAILDSAANQVRARASQVLDNRYDTTWRSKVVDMHNRLSSAAGQVSRTLTGEQ
jgi:predicted RNase H-like nuclease (RuvC/YqgF family)